MGGGNVTYSGRTCVLLREADVTSKRAPAKRIQPTSPCSYLFNLGRVQAGRLLSMLSTARTMGLNRVVGEG